MSRLLICILSCHRYVERRRRCAVTWVPEARERGADVVYVVASPTVSHSKRDGDIVEVKAADDYGSLPEKVCEMYRWALNEVEFDWLFKCDDDTYVRSDRLLAIDRRGHDYIGAEWTPGVGYASGGAGYLLSRRAVQIVADHLPESALERYPFGAEDLLVGRCLRQAGIPFCIDPRLVPFGNDELRPQPSNQIITAHQCERPWLTHHVEFQQISPTVTCRLNGGLGNRMFQIAAAVAFARRHGTHKAVFDEASLGSHRETVFRNLEVGATPEIAISVHDTSDFSYTPILHDPACNFVICGYLQSESYFDDCRDEIRELFSLPAEERRNLEVKYASFLGPQTISLHVRRGDYVNKPEYHPLQSLEYYREAIRTVEQQSTVTHILCFSDDPQWCRANFAFDPRVHVISDQSESLDLTLMSMCRHHVIANSTFSWWGAWLNPNPDKIVVAPGHWFGPAFVGWTDRDLIPDAWIRLSTDIPQNRFCSQPDGRSDRQSSDDLIESQLRSVPKSTTVPRFTHGLNSQDIHRLVQRDDPVVFEIGSNDGTDSVSFLREFRNITLHCFEPDPRPINRFRESIRDPRCILHEIAIGASDGQTRLFQSGGTPPDGRMADWDLSSSIRPPTVHLRNCHPWCTFEQTCTVPIRSLDSWLSEHPEIGIVDFVWADVQGAESDLISGAKHTLANRTRFIYTEFYDQPMYEGQIGSEEILRQLPDFECIGIYEGYNMLLRNRTLSRFFGTQLGLHFGSSGKNDGPSRRSLNLVTGFKRCGVEILENEICELNGCLQSWAPKYLHLPRNTLMGPNLVVVPTDDPRVWERYHSFITPSLWTKRLYERYDLTRDHKLHVVPAGVDTGFFNGHKLLSQDAFIYFKNRSEDELLLVEAALRRRKMSFSVIRYGHFQEHELIEAAKRSRFCILLVGTESDGIANKEIMATNTPCFVCNTSTWKYNSYPECPASSAPWFDATCGMIVEQFCDSTFDSFLRQCDLFEPRKYILEHHTLELGARRYLEAVFESHGGL